MKNAKFNTKAIAKIWVDVDPAEGVSEWYDEISGFLTHDHLEAIAWVKIHGRELRHGWRLN